MSIDSMTCADRAEGVARELASDDAVRVVDLARVLKQWECIASGPSACVGADVTRTSMRLDAHVQTPGRAPITTPRDRALPPGGIDGRFTDVDLRASDRRRTSVRSSLGVVTSRRGSSRGSCGAPRGSRVLPWRKEAR